MKKVLMIVACAAQLAGAQNEWKLERWMEVEGRYRGQKLGSSVGSLGKIGDSTQFSVSDVDGVQLYRVKSPADTTPRFFFPNGNGSLADFNGDGFKDLLISGNPTRIYLGNSQGVFDTIPFFVKYQEPNGYAFGERVAATGRINGDACDDLIVSDAGYPNGAYYGKVYIFFGGTVMDSTPSYILNGKTALSGFGWSVAAGDLNNDSYDEIIVKGYDQSGTGPHGTLRFAYIKIFKGGNAIDTTSWKYIKGGDNQGRGLASIDINGDGVKDLLWTNYSVMDSMESVFVHYSTNGDIDTIPNLILPDYDAYYVQNAGDMNGDGYNDIAVSPNSVDRSGDSYVLIYSGGPKMDSRFDAAIGMGGDSNFGTLGRVVAIGDVNNDGCADILIGAPNYYWYTYQGYFGIFLGSRNIPVTSVTEKLHAPETFALLQNFPNPFNPSTTIEYMLLSHCKVTLTIYNILGQKLETLVSEVQEKGLHDVHFDAAGYPTGMYVYEVIVAGERGEIQAETRTMLLLK
ncbi:MAG: FG-GAP-like repeat-containing protein [Bacteroidota bacterium]